MQIILFKIGVNSRDKLKSSLLISLGGQRLLKLKMADDVGERIVLSSSTIIFSSCAIFFNEVQKRKRRHSIWVRGYLQSCHKYGADCVAASSRLVPLLPRCRLAQDSTARVHFDMRQ